MRQIVKACFTAAIICFCFHPQIYLATTQEKSNHTESVLTLSKIVTSKMKYGEMKYGERHLSSIDVQGRFIYTITEVRSDDSITGKVADIVIGNLVYEIPKEESLRISKLTGVQDRIIPGSIGQDNAHAFFDEGAVCPKIGLKFGPRGSYLRELQFHFDWFTLDLDVKPGELSKLFCEWRRMNIEGKATDPKLLQRINRILKDERKEKTK
jgi:hypothetical protein